MVMRPKLLALDIDGVITSGNASFSASGEEAKTFSFHDLDAVTHLQREGVPVAFITGEDGPLVDALAERFGVTIVLRGAKDKLAAVQTIASDHDLRLDEIVYVGDSDRDVPAISSVGLGLAPINATPAARAAARRVLSYAGGAGAVAEAVRLISILYPMDKAALMQELERIAQDSLAAHERLLNESLPVLAEIASVFAVALRSARKLLFFGNGGSAADAQHIAGEFMGRFLRERGPLPALALTTDTSIITAIGNDWTFEEIFARQVRALARPGDVVIGISTSGNSPNVLSGLETGRMMGAVTVGFTGGDGGRLPKYSDYCFCAPADVTPRIQELHILAWHAICELVEIALSAV